MRRFLLVLLLTIVPGLALTQTDDRGFLTSFLEENLSGLGRTVTINGFRGALSSQASISEMTIADGQGVWITLRDVTIQWNRSALLRGAVDVNALTAAEIVMNRTPVADPELPTPEAPGFALPELPVSIVIGRIAADRIVLGEAVLGTAIEGTLQAALSLAGGEGTADLQLERTDDGPSGRVSLAASFANATRALVIDLTASEEAGGIATTLLRVPGNPAVDLSIKGSGILEDFTADISLASDGQNRLAGQVTLLASEQGAQNFRADLAGDLAPLFAPAYAEFFGNDVALLVEGSMAASGRLDLPSLRVTTRALQIEGALAVAPDGLPERVLLNATMGLPDGSPVLLPVAAGLPTRVGRADLTLDFDARQDDGWSLDAVLQGLDRADFKADNVVLSGSGRISRGIAGGGNVVGGTLKFEATGLSPTDPAVAAGLGDQIVGDSRFFWQEGTPLRLPTFALNGDGYGITASGLVGNLAQGFPISGTATFRAEDISRFSGLASRPLSGAVIADLRGGGTPLAGSFDVVSSLVATDLTVGVAEADNLLRGRSRIELSVIRDETGTVLRQLDIVAQSLQIQAQGTIATAGSDIVADIDFADLAVLGGPYRGRLTGLIRATGTLDSATVTLNADGESLAIGMTEVDALLAGPSRLSLEAGVGPDAIDLRQFDITAATLKADAAGRIAQSGSDVKANLAVSNLAALGGPYRGALAASATFVGTVDRGQFGLRGSTTNLGLGIPEADRVLAGRTDVSATVALQAGVARIESFTLGNPQITASAAGTAADLTLDARLANLAVILPDFPGPVRVSGTAAALGNDYRLNLTGTGPGQIDARVSGTIAANMNRANLTIAGSAQSGLANAFLRPRTVSGPVRFDLSLDGPLALSSLRGRVGLAGGRLSDPSLPFSLEGITANADLADGQARVTYEMGVTSGGRVAGQGSVTLTAPYSADLSAELSRVVLRDPRLYETRLGGQVGLSGPLAGGAAITGRITLIETEIRIPSTGLGNAGLLPDLVHQSEPADVRETRLRAGLIQEDIRSGARAVPRAFALDLLISAPNRVFIRGRGLDAELGGDLRLGGTTANIIPSGGFDLIRGRMDILGKRLILSRAQLRLAGSFDPFVDILASSESDGITASVQILGNVSSPDVSFVSEPELPEEEVVARLLFSRSLAELSTLQIAQLAGAIASLAGRGGEGIIGRLRQGFGLDDLDFQSSEDGGTTLRAGKYLSRNLYSEIVVGDEGQSEIQLNLDVSDSVTVRTTAGGEGGAGLGVFFERDY
jgi:translocation and assembly module TamB